MVWHTLLYLGDLTDVASIAKRMGQGNASTKLNAAKMTVLRMERPKSC